MKSIASTNFAAASLSRVRLGLLLVGIFAGIFATLGAAGCKKTSGGNPAANGGAVGAGGAPLTAGGRGANAGGSTANSAGAGTNDAGSTPPCSVPNAWDVTYNLDGSTFEIRDTPLGAGDQVNTCTPPYTADKEIGPGTMILRFVDANGAPGPGVAHIVSYTMDLEFTVAGVTTVHTVLTQQNAGGACGAATGTYAASGIHWNDPGLNLHTFGNVTCTGSLCSAAGLRDGVAQPDDTTAPQVLGDFTFTNGVGAFTMPAVLSSKDSTSSEYMTFKGTETSRKAVCACSP